MLVSSPSSAQRTQKQTLSSPNSSSNNTGINPKLLHLVQKVVTQFQEKNATANIKNRPSTDYVVHCLRAQNVEYQRKNLESLKKQVNTALNFVLKNQQQQQSTITDPTGGTINTGRASPASVDSRKRSRKHPQQKQKSQKQPLLPPQPQQEEEEKEEEEVVVEELSSEEEDNRAHDAQRAQITDGSALNASLRLRYEKLQRERDAEAREAAVIAELETKQLEASENNNNDEMNAENFTTAAEAGGTGNSKPSESPNAVTSTNTNDSTNGITNSKSRKRKLSDRRKSKSSSHFTKRAAFSSHTRMGGGGGGGGGSSDLFDDDDEKSALLRPVPRPSERYADLGGMDKIVKQIRELVEYPLVRPEIYRHLGVGPPRGILLRGPPGCGKTHLANAIAGQLGGSAELGDGCGVTYFRVSAPELVSGMSGESEGRIRDLFRAAAENAPSIVFMDELDAIAPKRNEGGSSRGMEKRMVAQLLTSMDSQIDPRCTRSQAPVIVLGATNRPDALDPALRRAGRFDKEIMLGVPDELARQNILKTMTKGMRLSGDFDFKVLARKTPGFVGADVRSLTKEAAVIAINRIFRDVLIDDDMHQTTLNTIIGESDNTLGAIPETCVPKNSSGGNINDGESSVATSAVVTEVRRLKPLTPEQLEPLFVTMDDFLHAVPLVQPSGKREGFAVVPDVTWDDIGAMDEIREELSMSVLEPIRNPEKFKILGLSLPAGVLLYGPPGCGKTLLAKAVANESGANFISVKGPELLDKYVGESEKAVRLVFERARSSSPCIVFFDELDSLCPKRGSDGGGSGVSERVVNQLLTEMDGLESRRSVFVIAATNRPELIDPAMMRPGRLDKLLYVPLPSATDRAAILSALSTDVKFGPSVDLDAIGKSQKADGFSGADCAALLREAGLAVLKEDIVASAAGAGKSDSDLCIEADHFDSAFHHVMPSVSKKDQARYDRIRNRMARARTRGSVSDGERNETTDTSNNKEDEADGGENKKEELT